MFTEITGDLFDPAHGFDAVGHGVNMHGVMGAGIAKTISTRWPNIMAPYRHACRTTLALGGYQRYVDEDGTVIYNMATQVNPGAEARISAVVAALGAVVTDCENRGYRTLGLPQIGCGIGGLDWTKVRGWMEYVAATSDTVDIVAVTYRP